MTYSSKLLAPALIALGVFVATTAYAGENRARDQGQTAAQMPGAGEDPKYPTPDDTNQSGQQQASSGTGEDPKYPTPDDTNQGGQQHPRPGTGEDPKYPTPDDSGARPGFGRGNHRGNGGEFYYGGNHRGNGGEFYYGGNRRGNGGEFYYGGSRRRNGGAFYYGGNNGANGGGVYHGGGGNNGSYGSANITCIINGQLIRVRSARECYLGPQYGYSQPQMPAYRPARISRQLMVSGGVQGGGYAYGSGYAYGGGGAYGYAPQPAVRYYQPASRAAMMQAEKRARRAARAQMGYAYGGGYAVQGGYAGAYAGAYGGNGYAGAYAMQGNGYGFAGAYAGGYAMQGNGFGGGMMMQGNGYGGKKHRKHHRARMAYGQQFNYDPGYVVHYGPTISKDGGY
jgi:hypothetical protein